MTLLSSLYYHRIFNWLASSFLVVGCGHPEASHTADIATDFGHPFSHDFFFREGSKLVRTTCNPNTTIFDRASCTANRKVVPAESFYHELETDFGSHLEQLSSMTAEAFIRVGLIDQKLLELLSAGPGTPTRPELPAQIHAAETGVADATTRVVGLREQISRIEQTLARHDDPDLRSQLATQTAELAAQTTLLSLAQARLATLRNEYVEANSGLLDPVMFRHLSEQRDQAVQAFDAYQYYVGLETELAIDLKRVLGMVEDNFVFNEDLGSSSDYMGIIMPFSDLVDDLVRQPMRYTVNGPSTSTTLSLDVPVIGTVKSMQCRFESRRENRCTEVLVTPPGGEAQAMENLFIHTRGGGLIAAHPLINTSPTGHWTFTVRALCGDGPIELTREPWCELGVD